MTLEQKIKLIDDLIAEDSDHNIRDYLDILEEIEHIENQQDMPYTWITPEDKENVVRLAETKSPKQIEAETKLSLSTIYRALKSAGVDVKKLAREQQREQKRIAEEARIAAIQARRPAVTIRPESFKNKTEKRPAPAYSNTGFLSVSKKYAV